MAKRSTRNRIRFESRKAMEDFNRCLEHYQCLETINNQQSPVININLTPLIVLLLEVEKTMKDFDAML